MQYLLFILTGLVAGLLGGLVGVGGGIVVIPALTVLFGYSQLQAQGTSLAFLVLPITLAAAYNYYKAGYVNIEVAVLLAVGFLVGSYFSSSLAVTLPDQMVKKGFAIFLILVATKLLFAK